MPELYESQGSKVPRVNRRCSGEIPGASGGGRWSCGKHAPVVVPDEEDRLWQSKFIGDHNPLALQRAVFFYVGKTFCLRGGQEQRDLKPSQFVRSYNPDCYTYVKNGSKNHSGINKVVPVYASVTYRPRCLVYLLDTYFQKFPPKAIEYFTCVQIKWLDHVFLGTSVLL